MLKLSYEACNADIQLRKKLKELISLKHILTSELENQDNPLKEKEYKEALEKIDELIGRIRFHSIDGLGILSKEESPAIKKAEAPKGSITNETAKNVGDRLKVNWDTINLEQFRRGLEVELEHGDLTKGDLVLTGVIVLAHLNETRDYYTKLDRAGL